MSHPDYQLFPPTCYQAQLLRVYEPGGTTVTLVTVEEKSPLVATCGPLDVSQGGQHRRRQAQMAEAIQRQISVRANPLVPANRRFGDS